MEEKRVLLAVVICLGLVLVYSYFVAPHGGKPPQVSAPASAPIASNRINGAASAPIAVGAPATGPASGSYVRRPEQRAGVALPGKAAIAITSYGGALAEDELLYPRYTERVDDKTVPIDLARSARADLLPLRVGFADPGLRYDATPDFDLKRQGNTVDLVQAHPERSDVAVRKRFVFDPQSYLFELEIDVQNLAHRPLDETLVLYDDGWQNPTNESTSFLTRRSARVTTAMCDAGDKVEAQTLDDLKKKGAWSSVAGKPIKWVAIDYRYFLLALVPHAGPAPSSCRAVDMGGGVVQSELSFTTQRLAPGQTATYSVGVFAGPKLFHVLQAVHYPDVNPDLGASVQFGFFAFIARPLLVILRAFQRLVVNWGLAIVLLTIFVKLLTFYWTNKSMLAMREMARLKPKLDALKERYGKDKQRMNQEVMNLYKANNVNPAAGCLPMLLQMPVWFALYEALENAVELYNAPLFGWIHNLAGPDPLYIIPILMGILMVAQQRITPTTVDSDQQKMMMYMMPIMFTVFSLMLPSGLSLYIIVNSVLTMIHQYWLNRRHPMPVLATAGRKSR